LQFGFIPALETQAAWVPGRTLRICCAETFGMSPKRYFDLRHMHLRGKPCFWLRRKRVA